MLHHRLVFKFNRKGIFPAILAEDGLAMRKRQHLTTARFQESHLFLNKYFVVCEPVLRDNCAAAIRQTVLGLRANVVLVELNLGRILKLT